MSTQAALIALQDRKERTFERFATLFGAGVLLLGCASGSPDANGRALGREGSLGTEQEHVVTNLQGCSLINNRVWCARTIYGTQQTQDVHVSSTTYDSGVFTIVSDQQGIAYGNSTMQTLTGEQNSPAVDGIRYVYTPVNGDFELIVRVTSTTSQEPNAGVGTTAEIGVMLRGEIPLAQMQVPDPQPTVVMPPQAPVGVTAWFGNHRTNLNEVCTDGFDPTLSEWMSANRPLTTSTMSMFPLNTRVKPSAAQPMYLRITRVGSDYATAESIDGHTWTPIRAGGGTLLSTVPNYVVGFFASANGNDGGVTWNGHPITSLAPQTATFEVVSITDSAPADRRSSWLGDTWAQASTGGGVPRDLQGFYVNASGVSYKMADTVDGTSRVSAFYPNGNQIPLTGWLGAFGVPRAITGDGSSLYVGGQTLDSLSNGTSYYVNRVHTCLASATSCDLGLPCCSWDGTSCQYATYPPTGVTLPLSQFGLIGGIAAVANGTAGSTVYVSDATNRRIHVISWPTVTGSNPQCGAPTEVSSFSTVLPAPDSGTFVPGPLAVNASNSHLWVLDPSLPPPPSFNYVELVPPPISTAKPRVVCFTPQGTACTAPQPASVDLSALTNPITNPTAIAVAPATGKLLITDDGAQQNVRVCDFSASPPCAATVGGANGVFGSVPSGSNPAPGSAPRFFSPVGAGSDSSGNTYVGQGAPLVTVTKVDASSGNIAWSAYGLGTESGAFDPGPLGSANASTPVSFYSLTRKMSFDLSKPTGVVNQQLRGHWGLESVTWNPFLTTATGGTQSGGVAQVLHPLSPYAPVKLPSGITDLDVRAGQTEAPMIRYISVNGVPTRYLFLPYTYCDNSYPQGGICTGRMEIFRFEGEIAVPCGALDDLLTSNGSPQLRMWIDANSNGHRPAPDCTLATDSECSEVRTLDLPSPFNVDVDPNADVWLTFPNHEIWRMPHQVSGDPAKPVPDYRTPSPTVLPIPNDFGSSLYQFFFFTRYDATLNTLYLVGWETGASPGDACSEFWDGHTLGALTHPVLAAYRVNSDQTLTKRYQVLLPTPASDRPDSFPQHVTDMACRECTCCPPGATNCDPAQCACAGDPLCTTPANQWNPYCCTGDAEWLYNSFDTAGDYVFIGERHGPVHVHRKIDGLEVTRLFAGAELSGAYADRNVAQNMKAIRLSTGEYLVATTDSMPAARVEVLRWMPYFSASSGPTIAWLPPMIFSMVGAL